MLVIVFFVVLAALVLSHEFGHFLFAKLRGVKVEEFGFGFPPRLFGLRKGETLYSINLLPLGGFVKIFGEDATEEKLPRSFAAEPGRWRALIIGAGVLFNVLLAWLLLTAGFAAGMPSLVESGKEASFARTEVRVLEVQTGTPAEAAGFAAGDRIIALRNRATRLEVGAIEDVQQFISAYRGESVAVEILRKGTTQTIFATPDAAPIDGKGALGIAMGLVGIERVSWYAAPVRGASAVGQMLSGVVAGIADIFVRVLRREPALAHVTGPVGIAMIVGDASQLGALFLLQLVAFLSINLAIVNLLPIPGLDGGRLLFLLVEAVRGAPVNQRAHSYAHTVGFVLLILFMLFITYRDLINL